MASAAAVAKSVDARWRRRLLARAEVLERDASLLRRFDARTDGRTGAQEEAARKLEAATELRVMAA